MRGLLPHFIGEESKDLGDLNRAPGHTAGTWQNWYLDPGGFNSSICAVNHLAIVREIFLKL